MHTLVLTDGGLAGLVAAVIASKRTDPEIRPAVLVPSGLSEPVSRAARVGCERLGLSAIELNAGRTGGGAGETRLLLVAAQTAAQNGCSTLIWGRQLGGDDPVQSIDLIGQSLDRATLISRLISLDLPDSGSLEIELPVIDMTDAQLAELALDLGVPLDTLAWWGSDTEERTRWESALRSVGWHPDSVFA